MKKKIIISLLILFIMLMPIGIYAENNLESNYKANVTIKYVQEDQKEIKGIMQVGCKAVYIAEPNTGKVFYEKNAHEKMYPASTTKILTALVVLENCKLEDKAVVSKKAIDLVPSDYSNAKLQVGEELSISDLLYALLIPSANEAANVLAEHVSGSIEAFAELCNKRARELGCETLHFVNPNGIHDENHYCSAYDLYLIAKECRKYEAFNEIVKTKSFTLPATNIYTKNDRTFMNRNEMLLSGTYHYSNCTGIKTGHTSYAGECFVGSSSYNDMDLISVVLGGKEKNSKGLNDRFYDTRKLYDFVYDNYSIKEIAGYGDTAVTITVGKATKETEILEAIVDTDILAVVPNDIDKENVQSSIYINEDIVAPINQNEVLGHITYYVDGLVYQTNIIASHSVEKIPYGLYNILAIAIVIITLAIFYIILKKSKRHRNIVFIIEIIIFIAICVFVIPLVKNNVNNAETKVIPANNVKLENKSYS